MSMKNILLGGIAGIAFAFNSYGIAEDSVTVIQNPNHNYDDSTNSEFTEEFTQNQQVSYETAGSSCSTCNPGCAESSSTGCGTCGSTGCSSCGCESSCLVDDIFSFTDDLKNIEFGNHCDPWSIGFGGALRFRHINEDNRLRPGGPGKSTYDQWRWQNWVEVRKGDSFAAHVEMIDASTFNQELFPLAIDENRADILQAYADVKLIELDSRSVYLRSGRQFLKYGSQHLVSPLAWANTYRTFEGFKLFSPGEQWDIEAFATQTVTVSGNHFHPTSADHTDESKSFSGVYLTNHSIKNNIFDFYWLYLDEQEARNNFMDGKRHTIGMRWDGKSPVKNCCGEVERLWFWDLEGAYQFGKDNDATGRERDVNAGFISAVLGHTWKKATWTPTVKGLFYWGSGDSDNTSGDVTTFSSLFPLGHAYWGLIDNFSGQNLIDYSLQASIKPTKKLTLLAAMHWFSAANSNDSVYNIAGAALPSGSGSDYGQELDLLATYVHNKNMSVQAGYFWHWYGDGIVGGPLKRDDASMFYIMPTLKY
jgi:Alginate export